MWGSKIEQFGLVMTIHDYSQRLSVCVCVCRYVIVCVALTYYFVLTINLLFGFLLLVELFIAVITVLFSHYYDYFNWTGEGNQPVVCSVAYMEYKYVYTIYDILLMKCSVVYSVFEYDIYGWIGTPSKKSASKIDCSVIQ